ncbi:YbaK/aminoacyl-tRNA synthetase-associated domain-containing protein [Bordetella sputigena]
MGSSPPSVSAGVSVHDRLKALLDDAGVSYRLLRHAAEGRSEAVAAIRGTAVGQGAKALVCRVKLSSTQRAHVLAVFPADRQADLEAIARAAGGKKASLASRDLARELTGCEIGAIPPFVFDDALTLLVDETLGTRYDEIVFNAGRLDASIVMQARDYLALVRPRTAGFTRDGGVAADAALSRTD